MIGITLCGVAGRMGQTLRQIIEQSEDLRIVGGIDREPLTGAVAVALGCPEVRTPDQADDILVASDAIIDFSAPDALRVLLDRPAETWRGKALVVGTTGLGEAEEQLLARAAEHGAVVAAANFSVGVNLLLQLVEAAARVLPEDQFDIEVVEVHHRRKVDAPSGTALALGRAAAAGRAADLETLRRDGRSGQVGARPTGEIGLHAVRGGSVVGEHRVHFYGEAERIELAHVATDRRLFAEGALLAARWAAGRAPGRYEMKDVLGF